MFVRQLSECSKHQSEERHHVDVDVDPVDNHAKQCCFIHEHVNEYFHQLDVINHVDNVNSRTDAVPNRRDDSRSSG